MVDNQILANGTRQITNSNNRIDYLYKPQTSQESQILTVEIIDQALYQGFDQVSFEAIAGDIDNNFGIIED